MTRPLEAATLLSLPVRISRERSSGHRQVRRFDVVLERRDIGASGCRGDLNRGELELADDLFGTEAREP